MLLALCAASQTQQGYVKTKGRLVNGNVVAGQRLSGTTVQIKGRNAVLSKGNGSFSFIVPANKFFIQSVKKQGYVLSDPDVLSKPYSYSSNPLILVMETPNQQMEDKLATERKLRRTLFRQLQQREDEIERLKEQNELTEEQYHKSLQDLYDEQEKSLNLVSQMAERYSKIDFDQIDEFNRRVSECIIEGRLTEADSLIKSKGDLKERIDAHNKHHEANVQARKNLEDSEAMELKDREDLAQDCYSQFLIHKLQHHPDSAAYYIEQRAMLDTTNVEWLYDAACYLKECGKNKRAFDYFMRANNQFIYNGESSEKHALILKNIAYFYSHDGTHDGIILANDFYNQAIIEFTKVSENHHELVDCYHELAICKVFLLEPGMTFDEAINSYDQDIKKVLSNIFNRQEIDLNNVYFGYFDRDFSDEALLYYNSVLDNAILSYGKECELVAKTYMSIGRVHDLQKVPKSAIEDYKEAYDIYERIDSLNPTLGELCEKIGSLYWEINDTLSAINFYEKSIIVWDNNYGINSPHSSKACSSLGSLYTLLGDYSNALYYYLKELDTRGDDKGFALYEISTIYRIIGNYDEAIKYLQLDLKQPEKFGVSFNKDGEVVKASNIYKYRKYRQLGDLYFLNNNFSSAIESYKLLLDSIQSIGGSVNDEIIGNGYMGATYLCCGDSINAIACFINSIKSIESILFSNSSDICNYSKPVFGLFNQKKYSQALSKAIATFQQLENVDDKKVISNVQLIIDRIKDVFGTDL